jgi:predicted nuclease of predicted toxin-antitoxin system
VKILIDQNISFKLKYAIKDQFPKSLHVSDVNLNDSSDDEIWQFARENDFTILTYDADFFDLSLIYGHPPKIIWIRNGNLSTQMVISLFIMNKAKISSFIENVLDDAPSCLELY